MIRKGFAIAGIRGGSGKTIVSLGLARALSLRGYSVAPFKKGPDYIDAAWLGAAAGNPCRNLDSFLFDESSCKRSFLESNPGCGLALLEGNRGLFDGMDVEGTHSTAELVKSLSIPLVMVVDCAKATRTVAALVQGCAGFDPGLSISGVILNNTSGERHRGITARSVAKYSSIPVIGNLSRITSMNLPERRLGLQTIYEHPDPETLIDELAVRAEEEIDIDALLSLIDAHVYRELSMKGREDPPARVETPAPVIGVVLDEAFNFYYPENIDALKHCGAEIIRLSALRDRSLPPLDGLYVGGGFPENFAGRLAANAGFRGGIREAVERGMPVYAECGGLIYLSAALHRDGTDYPMVGVFPCRFSLSPKPAAHGYAAFRVDRENGFYDTGASVRGHEFRYCRIVNEEECGTADTAFSMERGTGLLRGRDGVMYKNVMATFCHTHVMSAGVKWPEKLCRMARTWRENNG